MRNPVKNVFPLVSFPRSACLMSDGEISHRKECLTYRQGTLKIPSSPEVSPNSFYCLLSFLTAAAFPSFSVLSHSFLSLCFYCHDPAVSLYQKKVFCNWLLVKVACDSKNYILN